MGNPTAIARTFVIKAGMTPQDVINSKDATAQQKKMAYVFDSDGVLGYSQREADVFNATTITEKGSNSISMWTRYKDGTKKETKYVGDIASFKFAPKGEVNPYYKKEVTEVPVVAQKETNLDIKDIDYKPLPPLTQIIGFDTLTYRSKQDSILYNEKELEAWKNFRNKDNSAWNKYSIVDRAAWMDFIKAESEAWQEFEKADDKTAARDLRKQTINEARATRQSLINKARVVRKTEINDARNERMQNIEAARAQHCTQVKAKRPH